MAIYLPPKNAEVEIKEAGSSEIVYAEKQKTYTQEEVLAMIEQIQQGGQKK